MSQLVFNDGSRTVYKKDTVLTSKELSERYRQEFNIACMFFDREMQVSNDHAGEVDNCLSVREGFSGEGSLKLRLGECIENS